MQAAGTTAKQMNVIVCGHMCWQGACLFGEEEVSYPWGGEWGRGSSPSTKGPGAAVPKLNVHCQLCIGKLLSHPAMVFKFSWLNKTQRKLISSNRKH